ncbi:MAG: hypothetical protein K9M44_04365 [Candidatus Pacebacteria bacterium]|nr:hypothetical protein [Candidatus Paceibacterota bacterium]
MNDLLKILKLSQKAGDRLLIYNPEDPDNSWVAVSLSDYQKIIENKDLKPEKEVEKEELTSAEQADKIKSENIESDESEEKLVNSEQGEEEIEQSFSNFAQDNIPRPVYSYSEENDDGSGNPVSIGNVLQKHKGKWKIPNQLKESASEIVD